MYDNRLKKCSQAQWVTSFIQSGVSQWDIHPLRGCPFISNHYLLPMRLFTCGMFQSAVFGALNNFPCLLLLSFLHVWSVQCCHTYLEKVMKGSIPLMPWSLAKEKKVRPLILYFHAFNKNIKNIKFFTSHNLVSLVTPEGLTNTWNNHYPPVRFLCNGNVVHSSGK